MLYSRFEELAEWGGGVSGWCRGGMSRLKACVGLRACVGRAWSERAWGVLGNTLVSLIIVII